MLKNRNQRSLPCSAAAFTILFPKIPIAKDKFLQAQHLAANTISLPCGPHVSDQDISKIIEKMNEICTMNEHFLLESVCEQNIKFHTDG